MAAFLDVGLVNYFSIIFPVLLVFVIVFALLEKTRVIGANKAVHAIIAIAIAFIIMLSKDIITVINFMSPWFVVAFVFLVLLLVIYKLMGATDENIASFFIKNKSVQWLILGIGVVILFAALATVYGQRLLVPSAEGATNLTGGPTNTGTFSGNVMSTIFNTKVIGLIFVFLVAVFAIALLTREKL